MRLAFTQEGFLVFFVFENQFMSLIFCDISVTPVFSTLLLNVLYQYDKRINVSSMSASVFLRNP